MPARHPGDGHIRGIGSYSGYAELLQQMVNSILKPAAVARFQSNISGINVPKQREKTFQAIKVELQTRGELNQYRTELLFKKTNLLEECGQSVRIAVQLCFVSYCFREFNRESETSGNRTGPPLPCLWLV